MKNIPQLKFMKRGKTILPTVAFTLGGIFVLQEPVCAKFDGFYVGGSLGHLQQNTSIEAKQNPPDPDAHVNNTQAQQALPLAELFFGWGKLLGGDFYGGVEGQIDFVSGGAKKIAEDTNFIYQSGRKGLGMAALMRLGYLISPQSMIYGGIGVKGVNFEHNLFEKADKISAPFSKRSVQVLTEVGVETSPSTFQNLAFRFSYAFMAKRDMTKKTTSFPVNHMYRESGTFKSGVAEHAFKAGVIYRF